MAKHVGKRKIRELQTEPSAEFLKEFCEWNSGIFAIFGGVTPMQKGVHRFKNQTEKDDFKQKCIAEFVNAHTRERNNGNQ